MLIRNNAPVFGANATPYQQPGEWHVSLSTRNLVSNDHYAGGEEQLQRQTLQNYVTNRQNLIEPPALQPPPAEKPPQGRAEVESGQHDTSALVCPAPVLCRN